MPTKPKGTRTATPDTAADPPPMGLGVNGRELWEAVTQSYVIGDPASHETLRLACAQLDRAEMLAEAIERDGVCTTLDNGRIVEHPLIKAELQSRAFVARSLQRLVGPRGLARAMTSSSV